MSWAQKDAPIFFLFFFFFPPPSERRAPPPPTHSSARSSGQKIAEGISAPPVMEGGNLSLDFFQMATFAPEHRLLGPMGGGARRFGPLGDEKTKYERARES